MNKRRVSINGRRYTVLAANFNRLLVRDADSPSKNRWIINPRVQIDLRTFSKMRESII